MFCLSSANGCFKVIVSQKKNCCRVMSKTFFPILSTMKRTLLSLCDQAKPLWLHLVFFGNMHCLLSKNFFEPQEKNVSCETQTLRWKVRFTTVILIFFYCSSLVAIWPQCHALYEKPLFERWFICVCVFFYFFFSQIEFFNQNDDVLPFFAVSTRKISIS